MTRTAPYSDLLDRLSRQSVAKHFDAYADVAWDDPAFRIELDDPRWELDPDSPLGATEWYRTRPQPLRARIGLHSIVSQMKIGVEFEGILSQGLLQFASTLPNGAPEFRYAYHELIEEGQHSLMFQEFVNRTGLPAEGMSGFERFFAGRVPSLGRRFPELFFLFVLGGEAPIDHVQRNELRKRDALHPLLRRVMQIHVTEEARHLCFAKNYLLDRVPKLGRFKRARLKAVAPFIFAPMAQQMLAPPAKLVRRYGIPRSVVNEAYRSNPSHREKTLAGLESVRTLCLELDLVIPSLWRALGIWPDETQGEPPGGRKRDADDGSSPRLEHPSNVVAFSVPGVVRAYPGRWVAPMSA